MAEILITGIELSKEGYTEIRLYDDGSVLYKAKDNIYQDYDDIQFKDAKAQELPPHGDLIERSSVYKVLDDRIAFYKEAGDDYNACNIACIEGDIVVIPTIIEAST